MRPIADVLTGMLNAQKTYPVRKLGQFSNLKSLLLGTPPPPESRNCYGGLNQCNWGGKTPIVWQVEVDVASQNSLHRGFL